MTEMLSCQRHLPKEDQIRGFQLLGPSSQALNIPTNFIQILILFLLSQWISLEQILEAHKKTLYIKNRDITNNNHDFL